MNPSQTERRGRLLFAHGSRNPTWAQQFAHLRDAVQKIAPQDPVGLCYLELCEPDFAQGLQALVSAGCTHIDVIPVFLAPGKHTEADLPELIRNALIAHPDITLSVRGTLLEDPTMLLALAKAVAGGGVQER